jgi:hypothetical protein
MALPYFAEFGWEPLILKINPDEQEGIKDPDLCRTVPAGTRTWEAGCLPLGLTKWTGLRSVGLRSYFHLARLGDRIIRQESPAAAFFSTTMFPVMTLGANWHKRHGLPYVLDFQDPWFYERQKAEGGNPLSEAYLGVRNASFKSRLTSRIAGVLEPLALRRAAHVVSVSPAYPVSLCARYPWLDAKYFTVLPFGAAERDYDHLRACPARQTSFDRSDGKRHWVYVGRGGADMAFALRSLFLALNRLFASHPELRSSLRAHFIGTAYAPKERAEKTVEPLALEAGLGDIVSEVTDRIPYFEALQCLLDADALFVPGSDDPGYTASKIYPYILAQKPLLAVFHAESSVAEILKKTRAGTVVEFQSGETVEAVSERILATRWLSAPNAQLPVTDWAAFKPFTAREMTRRLCEVLDKAARGITRP